MVTITDVSKLANVSKATVSRVMSGSRGVREDSRLAVLKAAEELNYSPNVAAQNLATQSSHYVGVVLNTSDAASLTSYLPSISRKLKSMNKLMLVQFAESTDEQQNALFELNSQCEAVIMINGTINTSAFDNVLHMDGSVTDAQSSVGFDYQFAAESACRYLLGKGHRKIALLVDDLSQTSCTELLNGYKNAIQNFSLPYDRRLVIEAKQNLEQSLLSLMNSFTQYSAIVVKRDNYAAEAMRLMRQFNIQVPNDISVVSLEDSPLAQQLNPTLTCISHSSQQLAEVCMENLEQMLEKTSLKMKDSPLISGRLVCRESVSDL
ncbi:LacI family transcriptional regulator [Vibrio sp. S17_S38]|uniref:LacI family DNA-binding transcriptional regulator n=1 Tax=Vibrio sp. S17_S38 TaxID=2720229 RepID=UPI001680B954|nr:LacI family DNA-binding transcriptional regulator [Vibrio sp. S17_S38]MBD1573717.1 LacI family transcriptional regulator [Vibrio sp. S17_S38]